MIDLLSKNVFKYSQLLLLCAGFLFSTKLSAQNKGVISGSVYEKQNPVEFVSVILSTQADSAKVLKVVATDSTGKFIITDVPYGDYILKFQMIGYLSSSVRTKVDEQNKEGEISSIQLQPDSKLLDGVEVVSQKDLIKKTTQGFIINAKDNLTQASGTATDLLKNTPTVVVFYY